MQDALWQSELLHSISYGVAVEKIFSALPPGMKALLDQCIARGLFGDQAMTVRHFVTVGLEQLIVQGRLIDVPSVPKIGSNDDGETENQGGAGG